MKFTDIFIRRPILALSISLLILFIGLGSMFKLNVMEFPETSSTIITVKVDYPGATAKVIQGFITDPLQQAIGSVDGLNYMTASSVDGSTTITCYIKLGFDPNSAMTNIMIQVQSVQDVMPSGALSPTINVSEGNTFPALILAFTSDSHTKEQISAYLTNVFSPKIYGFGGVSEVLLWGDKPYSMRVWLMPDKMISLGITSKNIYDALNANSLITASGQLQTPYQYITVSAKTNLTDVEQYQNLIIKNYNGNIIRLKDIAMIELGANSYNIYMDYDGQPAVALGILTSPTANQLSVIDNITSHLDSMRKSLPTGVELSTVYNTNDFIQASINDVIVTIVEATLIVTFVMFLFLGSLRSVSVPLVAIPLSMIGTFFLMMLMGFSINILTLLAMVLAIGLVVDDAIVVLENIYRHIEDGKNPFMAAILGAREVSGPVIVMTLTLAAVFAPIGMMGGVTGSLFTEFAYSLAASVIISGIIALTLSPMICSKVISPSVLESKSVDRINRVFDKIKVIYKELLIYILSIRLLIILFATVIFICIYFLYSGIAKDSAPQEDQGFIGVQGTAPSASNINYLSAFNESYADIFNHIPGKKAYFITGGYPQQNNIFGGMSLIPWGDRSYTQMELAPILQEKIDSIAGLQSYVFQQPSLPGTNTGPPVQFVLTTYEGSYHSLSTLADKVIEEASKSGSFLFLQKDLRFDDYELILNIDYKKAGSLGITNESIGSVLSSAYAGGLVNYFNYLGYSYEVISQVSIPNAQTPEQLLNLQIKTSSGELVPLRSFITYSYKSNPISLNTYQQFSSTTISAVPSAGVTQGQALSILEESAKNVLPKGYNYNYAGASLAFMQQGNTMMIAFVFALIVIFLMLSAKFESFRDPLIILISVPMSICGALIPLYIGNTFGLSYCTINIYSQLGLITLIGLISKHGILIVEFANQLQEQGMSKLDAIIESASIRLRPILMTTTAMVAGIIPLLFSSGAGAVSRHSIAVVIVFGLAIGTIFTIFVVPTMYTFLAKDRRYFVAQQADEKSQIENVDL